MSADNVIELPREQRRLAVNMNVQTADELSGYMRRHNVGVTEAVRRFVGVAAFILRAMDDGNEVLIRKGGTTDRVTFSW